MTEFTTVVLTLKSYHLKKKNHLFLVTFLLNLKKRKRLYNYLIYDNRMMNNYKIYSMNVYEYVCKHA